MHDCRAAELLDEGSDVAGSLGVAVGGEGRVAVAVPAQVGARDPVSGFSKTGREEAEGGAKVAHARHEVCAVDDPLDAGGGAVNGRERLDERVRPSMPGFLPWNLEPTRDANWYAREAMALDARCSVWDSEAYCLSNGIELGSELHLRIDARLRELALLHPASMLVVDKPRNAAPWPTYDQMEVSEILDALAMTSVDPNIARLYEGENQRRPEVADLVERLVQGESIDELIAEREANTSAPTHVPFEEDEDSKGSAVPVHEGVAGTHDVVASFPTRTPL